jgi:hypothetical protein
MWRIARNSRHGLQQCGSNRTRAGAVSAPRWSAVPRRIASRSVLCARAQRSDFYESLGWTTIERNVGPKQLNVLIRDAPVESGDQAFAAMKIDKPKPVR